jgi:hypothetical protein
MEASGLDALMQLEVVTYQHRLDPEYEHMNLPRGLKTGFIAQQVEQVLPQLVADAQHPPRRAFDGTGGIDEAIRHKGIKTLEMIPLLVKAIQDQQAQIDALQTQLAPLRNRLAELEGQDSVVLSEAP